jgi:hypothetical protein
VADGFPYFHSDILIKARHQHEMLKPFNGFIWLLLFISSSQLFIRQRQENCKTRSLALFQTHFKMPEVFFNNRICNREPHAGSFFLSWLVKKESNIFFHCRHIHPLPLTVTTNLTKVARSMSMFARLSFVNP